MTNDIWNARREKLAADVRASVLALFEHTGSEAMLIDLDPPHDVLVCVAGDRGTIAGLLATTTQATPDP